MLRAKDKQLFIPKKTMSLPTDLWKEMDCIWHLLKAADDMLASKKRLDKNFPISTYPLYLDSCNISPNFENLRDLYADCSIFAWKPLYMQRQLIDGFGAIKVCGVQQFKLAIIAMSLCRKILVLILVQPGGRPLRHRTGLR